MHQELLKQIEGLSRDQAIEAARFLAASALGNDAAAAEASAPKEIVDQPYANLGNVEMLARILLIAAMSEPEGAREVERAIAGVGQKQIILGGAEIVALAGLALVALKVIVTRGVGRTKRKIEVTETNGQWKVKMEEEQEPLSISADVAAILRQYLPVPGRK